MTDKLKTAADRVGQSLVAGTQALSDAVLHACAALISINEGEEDTNQLGVMQREAKRLYQALGTIMDARQAQIHARVSALKLAQTMDIDEYGDGCPCRGTGKEAHDPTTARMPALAIVA